jgi:hypothetical protein
LSRVVKCASKKNTEEESRLQRQQQSGAVAVESQKLISNAQRPRVHAGLVGFLLSSEKSGLKKCRWTSKTSGSVTANDLQQTLQHPMPKEVHEDRHKGENSKGDSKSSFLFRVHARILLRLSPP